MAKHRLSARNKARRRAVDTLFEADIKGFGTNPEKIRELIEARCQITTAQTTLPPYSVELTSGVAEHIYEIDELISENSRDWALDRMPKTDLAILRMATWEIKFNTEVPWKIAIDEAVGISKDYSTDDSPCFINAVLDAIAKSEQSV